MNITKFYSRFLTLALIITVSANAQTNNSRNSAPDSDEYIANMSTDQLLSTYNSARLFHQLDAAVWTFDQSRYCGKYLDKADETASELEQLNQIRNKTTNSYGVRAAEVKEANTKAIADYEKCYDDLLPGFGLIEKEQIFTYTAFASRYDAMVGNYKSIADLDSYILKLKAALENSKKCRSQRSSANSSGTLIKNIGTPPDDVMGTMTKIHRKVEISPGGRGYWRKGCEGYQLRFGDVVRTGPLGHALIRIVSHYAEDYSPEVHLGPNSEVEMTSLVNKRGEPPQTTLDLIRGKLRFIKDTFLNGGKFEVRTGTSLCGIRGTEVFISYDPESDKADYILNHGDAYYKTADGPEVTLRPRTGVIVTRGQAGHERIISDSDWAKLESGTTIPYGRQPEPDSIKQQTIAGSPPAKTVQPTQPGISGQSRAKNAGLLTNGLLSGLRDVNVDLVYQKTGGAYHSSLNERKTQSGNLAGFLQKSRQRPISFQVGCTVCNAGSDECWTYADITTVAKPDEKQRVIFESQLQGSRAVIVTSRNWSAENEKSFHAKGRAYCE